MSESPETPPDRIVTPGHLDQLDPLPSILLPESDNDLDFKPSNAPARVLQAQCSLGHIY